MTYSLDISNDRLRQSKSDASPKKSTKRRVKSGLVGDARKRQVASIKLSNLVNIAKLMREEGEILNPEIWLAVLANTLASAPAGKHHPNLEWDRKSRWWYGLDALTLEAAAKDCGLEYDDWDFNTALHIALTSWRNNPSQKPLGPYTIGKMLGIPKGIRRAAKASFVFAYDENRQDRAEHRRELERSRMEKSRRRAGAIPRQEYEANSLSNTKPWEAEGISRRTWYNRKNKVNSKD